MNLEGAKENSFFLGWGIVAKTWKDFVNFIEKTTEELKFNIS
jgi:hypothetical protein